jgi:receptor-binding and translocation channel-forming TcA subunit of Tc toxin
LWRSDPFDPHAIAQYRQVAYQTLTVMRYLDNLIAWGDQQFGIDSLESINIATQLYVLADQILGRKPQTVPPAAQPLPQTFNELDKELDVFSNALVTFENLIPPMPPSGGGTLPAAPIPSMLYFCIPPNEQLLQYRNTIESRLYNIRHCLNIDGVFSPAVLFPPPINPMDLVRALAGGESLTDALGSLNAPLPYYRFATMLAKANEFVADVKSLGGALLAALEKKDGEALALLRQGQETALLQAVRSVKEQQIDDANITIVELQKAQEVTTIRRDYYASRSFISAGETVAISLSGAALLIDAAVGVGYILSGALKLIPDFMVGGAGFGGSPTVNATLGGQQIGNSAEEAVKMLSSISGALEKSASITSVLAGYQRRADDWQFQTSLANKELEQNAQQVLSAQKKLAIAKTDLANHDLQISNSQSVADFMTGKYTNRELYQWFTGQVSQTYFAAYNLAFDLAKRAEQCYRYEVGLDDSGIIGYGYWNSLRSGLQAGESLSLDLRRLESAYLDQNRREFECTKHLSLALVAPQALLNLQTTGICNFDFPEELFDLDFPGHYFRRIKTVSISIPCVAGPYTTVNATLRLLKNMVRTSSAAGGQYEHNNDGGVFTDDDRFRSSNVRINAIATSSAQTDSGLFELNFRDERYLPFEGAGAVSGWQLELMQDPALRSFAYETISDVIVHVRYTAREDAGIFKMNAIAHLKDVLAGNEPQLPLFRLFDLVHEFPTEWYTFLNPPAGGTQALTLNIQPFHFPYLAAGKSIALNSFGIVAKTKPGGSYYVQFDPPVGPVLAGGTPPTLKLTPLSTPAGNPYQAGTLIPPAPETFDPTQPWTIAFGPSAAHMGGIAADDLSECYLVVGYTLS